MTDTLSVPTLGLTTASRPLAPTRASRPVHGDHDVAPAWMRVTGAVLLLGGLALTSAVLAWPGDAPEAALLVPGVVAVVTGFLLVLARTGVTVTDDHVVLRFRPLPARRIDRSRVVDVRLSSGRVDVRRHRTASLARRARTAPDARAGRGDHRRPRARDVRPDGAPRGDVPRPGGLTAGE